MGILTWVIDEWLAELEEEYKQQREIQLKEVLKKQEAVMCKLELLEEFSESVFGRSGGYMHLTAREKEELVQEQGQINEKIAEIEEKEEFKYLKEKINFLKQRRV